MLKQRVCDIVVKAHIAGDMDLKFHGKTFNSYAPKILAIQWLLTFSKGWKLMLSENLITLDSSKFPLQNSIKILYLFFSSLSWCSLTDHLHDVNIITCHWKQRLWAHIHVYPLDASQYFCWSSCPSQWPGWGIDLAWNTQNLIWIMWQYYMKYFVYLGLLSDYMHPPFAHGPHSQVLHKYLVS